MKAWKVSSTGALMKIGFDNPLQFLIFEGRLLILPNSFQFFWNCFKGRPILCSWENRICTRERPYCKLCIIWTLSYTTFVFATSLQCSNEMSSVTKKSVLRCTTIFVKKCLLMKNICKNVVLEKYCTLYSFIFATIQVNWFEQTNETSLIY